MALVEPNAKPGQTFMLFGYFNGVAGDVTTDWTDRNMVPYYKGTWAAAGGDTERVQENRDVQGPALRVNQIVARAADCSFSRRLAGCRCPCPALRASVWMRALADFMVVQPPFCAMVLTAASKRTDPSSTWRNAVGATATARPPRAPPITEPALIDMAMRRGPPVIGNAPTLW